VTIQDTLSKAISTLLRSTIEIIGAGRTDSGVHAKQMYAHFDTAIAFNKDLLVSKLNSFLPPAIAIHRIIAVSDDAHARFDATSRTYEYHIHTYKDVFINEGSWYFFHKLNVEKMNEAASVLLSYTDFECFSKVHTDVKTFNCKIKNAYWTQQNHKLIFTITADRFLRNMVRAIVGTLINIGLEKIPVAQMHQIIASKNRNNAGFSVPALGLYLTKVEYPYIDATDKATL
jgi:tRNA pseudouridine38-40 synthase